MSKINQILTEWKEGDLHSLKWLRSRGISQRLAYKYADKLKALERVGPGIYKRVGEPINWMGVIRLFQEEIDLKIHVSSKTALELHGHSHYLPMGEKKIYIRSYSCTLLPKWTKLLPSKWELIYKRSKMFPPNVGLLAKNFNKFPLIIASRELAILELIDSLNLENTLETIENNMSGLVTLRGDVVQNLLEECSSIKVKRVFLALAEKLNLPFFKDLDLSKINLGKGKRVIVKGGELNKKYNITVDRKEKDNPF